MKTFKLLLPFFIGIILMPQPLLGQQDASATIDKINILNFNYYQSINKNPASSLDYAKEAFSYYDSIVSTELKFKITSNFATALYINESYSEALLVLDKIKALDLQDNNQALYFTLRGLVETDLNLTLQAEESYQKALKLYTELNDKNNEFTVLNNLGLLYNNIGDYKKSLESYINCYAIIKDLEIQVDRYKYYMNIGTVNYNLNDFGNALSNYDAALQDAIEKNDTLRIFKAHEKIAECNVEINKAETAIEHYNISLNGYLKLGLKKEACTILLNLGDIYNLKNNKEEALKYYKHTQSIAKDNNFALENHKASLRIGQYHLALSHFETAESYYLTIIESSETIANLELLKKAYNGLYQIEKHKNNNLFALKYLEDYLKYDSNIRENQLISQNEQIEVQFNLKQKELELEKNELLLENRKQQVQGLVIFAVLSALVLILILTFYIQKRKAERLLSIQNTKINSQNEKLVHTNKEIKAKRKELSDLNSIKDQLLSIIAHDVKSPMTDLYNLLVILRHNLNAIHKDELKKNLAIVESSTSNILNFLNNILNWTISQSSGIQVKLSSFSLNELINTNLKLVESSVVAKELTVTFKPHSKIDNIKSDLNIIDFALRNILSNAVKFTNKKGTIIIDLHELSSSMVEIRIADSGIGFNEDIHDLLKNNTERVPSALGTNTEKGYGIGLSLCKKMLAKIDSRIMYEQNNPSGSIFSLHLTLME